MVMNLEKKTGINQNIMILEVIPLLYSLQTLKLQQMRNIMFLFLSVEEAIIVRKESLLKKM